MKKIILVLVFIGLFSCKKSEKENKINLGNWLIGTWENKSEQGDLIEIWAKVNDSLYTGHCYFIKAKDTLHFETIQLKQIGDNLFYISSVKGQNSDQAVKFKMTTATNKQLIFENPKHDYPQKIVYNQITNDSLIAIISGMQQKKSSTENYPMKKKKKKHIHFK